MPSTTSTHSFSEEEEIYHKDGLKKMLLDFMSNTSAHGYSQIILHNVLSLKALWFLIIVLFNAFMGIQIHTLVVQYSNKPVKTKMTIKTQQSQVFPMVTICNTNNIKRSQINGLKNTTYFKGKDYLLIPNTTSGNTTDTNEGIMQKMLSSAKSDFQTYNANSTAMRHYINAMEILAIMSSLAENEGPKIFKYGHQFEEMFLECKWRKVFNCLSEKYWQQIWHWRYGNCYVFNNGKSDTFQRVTQTGALGGLSLKLNVDQDQYLEEYITDTAGIVLHIGEPLSREEPYYDGFNLAPNLAHYIDLKVTKVSRVDPFKNGSCAKHYPVDLGKRSFAHRKVEKISIALCKDICLATEQNKQCGCTSHWLPSLDGNTTCQSTDTECAYRVILDYHKGKLPCLKNCNPPCDETLYNPASSTLGYPTLRIRRSTKEIHELDNYLKVVISFSTFETQYIIDEEYYFFQNLLGDIGGSIGLMSGMSVMTVVEFVIFIGHGFIFLCSLIWNR